MSLRVQHVRFSYREDRPVLRDVSFHIPEGRMVCLLGQNGAGKSTLFRLILGLLPGYEGEVLLHGTPAKSLSIQELSKRIAYIPQSSPPTFNYTVSEMVLMGTTAGLGLFASPGARQREVCEEAMERLGIADLRNRGFAEISGGERQLALIARALAQETDILLMDEPTANLDYGNQIRVLEQIRQLAGKGFTILEATHQPDQAFLFADEVLALKDGTILAQGDPRGIVDASLVRALYGVEVEVESVHQDRLRVLVPVSAVREQGQGSSGRADTGN